MGYIQAVATTRQPRAARRRAREREIVDATRALFDERGLHDVRVDRIARRVGINKALIYRHFASKEELFALTITRYLAEIEALLQALDEETSDPRERLRRGFETFAEYGIEHPAFLDGALSLLRQPAADLRAQLSDAVWLRLGRGIGACTGWLAGVLRDLDVPEPELRANGLYLQAIGVLHLGRSGVGVRMIAPGVAESFPISDDELRAACVQLALAATSGYPGTERCTT
jgi:AcrR family transcriptional regulator